MCHFSGPSRVALIYAVNPDDEICVYDPQSLLEGHQPKFRELYIDSDQWRRDGPERLSMRPFGHIHTEKNLELAGLISFDARSRSLFYQMWFTEHHLDTCSTGPIERWLEHAAWRLSHDLANQGELYTGISGYFLREYATHAVRDHLVDTMNVILGWDSQIRIYPVLDAVLGISKTAEEGLRPRGKLTFIEPGMMNDIKLLARFPSMERPGLENFKHVRKLLQSVEDSNRRLVSDGKTIIGITDEHPQVFQIEADFRSGHGFLSINNEPVCSFSDGNFSSTNRKANLVQVEEILLESKLEPETRDVLYKIVSQVVHHARNCRFGCALIVDLNNQPLVIPGQVLEQPLDLTQSHMVRLAQSLARVDGALHVGIDLKLHRFACLMDGIAIDREDRARGARFNSALRFTAGRLNVFVVVVSADRPVSVIQEGMELNAQCEWKPLRRFAGPEKNMRSWVNT